MSQISPETETLPCPFCGASARMADTGGKWLVCDDCGAEGSVADTEQGAIENWNRRFHHAQTGQQWQPIETAPKDIEVFVWAPDWNKVGRRFIAKWEDNRYASKPRPYWSYCDERIWGTTKVRQCQPTHWMPLPTPPALSDTSTDGECRSPACERDIKALMDQCGDMFAEIERLRAALAESSPVRPCPGCDGHECDSGCAYPGAVSRPDRKSEL